jgi:glycerophosphoryl diester phosphodiesterase
MKVKKYLLLLPALPFVFGFTNIAHRGDNQLGNYAEHSYEAYDRADAEQANYIELDVWRTSDGVLVVNHDQNLSSQFGANVDITTTPYQQLLQYRNSAGEPIHSLSDVLDRYKADPSLKFMIEPKDPQALSGIIQLLNQKGLANRALLESTSQEVLQQAQNVAPSIARAQLGGDYNLAGSSEYYANNRYDDQASSYLHQMGKKYLLWGVNDAAAMKRIVDSGNVDGLITDFPGRLSQILGITNYPAKKINGSVVVKYKKNWRVNVWNGYGKHRHFSGQRVQNGSRHQVYEVAIEDGKTWYNIGGNHWLEGKFVATYPIKQANGKSQVPNAHQGVVKLAQDAQVYSDPVLQRPAGKTLPAGSSWKFFASVTNNGQTVYNLGGNQWISSDSLEEANTNVSGVLQIKYKPGYGINMWARPDLTQFTGRRLKDGTHWKFFSERTVNGRTVYNLGGNQWIDSQYAEQVN